jgi:two-component system aerobic respiration control sensor histidine kinase ArcB
MDNTAAHDINQLQQALEVYKSEVYRLRSIIDNLPGSIYWKDKDGVYLGRNQSSAESLKNMGFPWREEAIIGKTDYDLFAKDMADQFRAHDMQVMDSGKASSHEETVPLKTGPIVQLSTKAPYYDEKGRTVGLVGNTVDITYLKNIQAELIDAKNKAEAANQLKSAFIRNMEHDIRTPFSGIYSIATVLESQETDNNKKKSLNAIVQCAKELLDYCNSILDFAKIETGALPCISKKFDIKKLIQSVIITEIPAAQAKGLALTVQYDENLPAILIGDNHRLQRVLLNLISNAIKFTQAGHVKITVELAQKTDAKNCIVRIKVADTGIGIAEDKQLNIYEKFSRLNPSNQGMYKGTGLGLSIVKQFVSEMGGEIDLQSEIDKGTVFLCTLPFELPLINDLPLEGEHG